MASMQAVPAPSECPKICDGMKSHELYSLCVTTTHTVHAVCLAKSMMLRATGTLVDAERLQRFSTQLAAQQQVTPP